MELVYLWVEEYKNIKKQGFNFSPRFECKFKDEYDENGKLKDNCELIIDKNKDYVSIFPENINITAIVGENGSGKSSIYETINNLIEDLKNHKFYKDSGFPITKNILIFKLNKKLYYISTIKLNTIATKISDDFSLDIEEITYSFDNKKIFDSDFEEIIDKNRIKLEENEIAKILTNNLVYKKDFKLSSFMYIPYKIEIFNSFEYEKIIDGIKEKLKNEEFEKASSVPFEEEKDAEQQMHNNIYNFKDHIDELKKIEDIYHQFLIIWFIENHYFDSDLLRKKEKLLEVYEKQEENEKINEDAFLNPPTKNIDEFTEHEKELYFYNFHYYFSFDFEDSLGRKFLDLSHGERVFFGQLISIYHKLTKSENVFLLNFDEPELTLHPNWQKKYLNELLNLLKQFKNDIHLIITSHSPFILSDLPKENIIFLEKGKQVYPFEDNQQTFGANIHTLLSHGFFMKDGLMGEFAKSKIDDVIKYLNNDIKSTLINDEGSKYYFYNR
ncbi:AAA family ATPase [Campylobacterota bacterium DY0563]